MGAITGYWLIAIRAGQPHLVGPFASDAEREGDLDMWLIEPAVEFVILIDPDNVAEPGKPWAWKPSQQYVQDRLDAIDNSPDPEDRVRAPW